MNGNAPFFRADFSVLGDIERMLRFLGRFHADFQLTSGWIEPLRVGRHAPFSPNITREDYHLLGCTALYDAMETCISELQQKVTHDDRVLVTIITDGYENASRT